MHEAAIVQGILDIAIRTAQQNGAAPIRCIKLRLGEFRGVVREALEFCFEAMKRGTLAEQAALEVETIKLRAACANCGEIECAPRDYNFLCPHCGEVLNILAGREMQVEYVELD
ncbi:MAG: hydrogenase maturation nickel metallochaperone HypA [Acidobacteria bacterium]|nr:hydrogenase maturation nickel metallochaperone HypA [Acidobacteriota bacterium]MBI3427193.1 hydrogenase maturation nickel metallochaperone HypA [Acidobacteriota bacterium]